MTTSAQPKPPNRLPAHCVEQDMLVHLVARLSHDLRAPVRAIVELASWIDEEHALDGGGDPDAIGEYLTLLKQRGMRLDALITNLTKFAKVGHSDKPFDGNWEGLLRQVSDVTPLMSNFDVTTRLEAVPSIASDDLDVLIGVLMSNATRHHRLGYGQLRLSVQRDSDRCLLEFEDDGPGIPTDLRDSALEMFVTLDHADKVEGSGLGLPIAQRIADHYSGGLAIHPSSTGQGCRVSVWFPA